MPSLPACFLNGLRQAQIQCAPRAPVSFIVDKSRTSSQINRSAQISRAAKNSLKNEDSSLRVFCKRGEWNTPL
jgi:hypothetical protein